MTSSVRRKSEFLDPIVAAAATHPTRVHALTILFDREATASEIGARIGRSTQHVGYHLNQLEALDLVEVTEKRPVHGGRVVANVYRATGRPLFDQASWEAMSEVEQAGVTMTILGVMSEDVNSAVAAGTINRPSSQEAEAKGLEPNHISRSPMLLDREGWNETADILEHALEQLIAVHERSVERSGRTGDQLISTKVELLQFQSPELQ